MTDILLTGAGGQVGSEIGRRGRHAGLAVCALDRLGLDITDRDAIRAIVDGIQPRMVVNAAAYISHHRRAAGQSDQTLTHCATTASSLRNPMVDP